MTDVVIVLEEPVLAGIGFTAEMDTARAQRAAGRKRAGRQTRRDHHRVSTEWNAGLDDLYQMRLDREAELAAEEKQQRQEWLSALGVWPDDDLAYGWGKDDNAPVSDSDPGTFNTPGDVGWRDDEPLARDTGCWDDCCN